MVEVMESSAGYDREVKVPLYARFGIPETWSMSSGVDRGLSRAQSGGLPVVHTRRRGERLSPAAFPQFSLTVDAVLG